MPQRAISADTPVRLSLVGAVMLAVVAFVQVRSDVETLKTNDAQRAAEISAVKEQANTTRVDLAEMKKDLGFVREKIEDALADKKGK